MKFLEEEKMILKENRRMEQEKILSDEEIGYRRGFAHGHTATKMNPNMTWREIERWRYSQNLVGAPGTFLENKVMSGLTRENNITMNCIEMEE